MPKIQDCMSILLFFTVLSSANPAAAANIELMDFSGHDGTVYTILWLHDAPNEISSMEIVLESECNVLFMRDFDGLGFLANGDNLDLNSGFGYSDCVLGVQNAHLFANFKEPIPKGASGPLALVKVLIWGQSDSEISVATLNGDVAGWTKKNAVFTYLDEDNDPPEVVAGNDKVIISTVYLDGSQSYDFDGMIVEWRWDLVHRTHSVYNQTLLGKTVTVTDLATGVYDVALTVTDNSGISATDLLTLSASGSRQILGDVNGNSKLDLPDALEILRMLTGQ